MQNRYYTQILVLFLAISIFVTCAAHAEVAVIDNDRHLMTAETYARTDVIAMDNNVNLDQKIRDDRVQYIGIDYSVGLDFKFKDAGPEMYLKWERYGPYKYDAPVFINNTLNTYTGKIAPYTRAELLPRPQQFWLDIPIYKSIVRAKGGLYAYKVGHGLALSGEYENYGMSLYSETDNFKWNLYYCWPDVSNENYLGPKIKQEKSQGIGCEHSKAYFLATDVTLSLPHNTIQPYVGILMDRTDTRRIDYFTTPTREDNLGTVGLSWDIDYNALSLGFEFAQNFGKAVSSTEGFDSVEHRGYAVYATASYAFGKFTPHTSFLYASGNKLTTDMITNGDTTFTSSRNNAFSVYSPLNAYLADSIYAPLCDQPLVAMGNGYGINYGVPRPTTFADPGYVENIVLNKVGFDLEVTDKLTTTFDWWFINSAEKGIGLYNGVPKVISPNIGCEADFYAIYAINKTYSIEFSSGLFLPGSAYREERTDTTGSLFTPFVRGDGKADPAYQIEVSLVINY